MHVGLTIAAKSLGHAARIIVELVQVVFNCPVSVLEGLLSVDFILLLQKKIA